MSLTYKGPAKSIPVKAKGGASLTQNDERGASGYEYGLA